MCLRGMCVQAASKAMMALHGVYAENARVYLKVPPRPRRLAARAACNQCMDCPHAGRKHVHAPYLAPARYPPCTCHVGARPLEACMRACLASAMSASERVRLQVHGCSSQELGEETRARQGHGAGRIDTGEGGTRQVPRCRPTAGLVGGCHRMPAHEGARSREHSSRGSKAGTIGWKLGVSGSAVWCVV